MIRINQLKLPITHTSSDLIKKIKKTLRLEKQDFQYQIIRQSLDARNKHEKCFSYTVDVKIANEQKIIRRVKSNQISVIKPVKYKFPEHGSEALGHSPVIVGSGPAGLFCAWYLAKEGYRPLLIERGEAADLRQKKVQTFWNTGKLDVESNVQFGEGGAGTFSDGKLNTLVKDPSGRNHEVLNRFVSVGAPVEITYQQKPHLGTDELIGIVQKLRNEIIEMGGTVRFQTKLTDLIFENNHLKAIEVNGEEQIPTEICVLAIGHSARDTFEMLSGKDVPMEPKPFAVGVRIEHPQVLINQAMYGEDFNEALGAAAYKVTHQCSNGRGVYSFCMCPGGYVVNASSEQNRLAVNGMSYQARDSRNANSAMIVTVRPEDFGNEDPLSGIAFQRRLEEGAFQAADGKVPIQLFEDFCQNKKSEKLGSVIPCIKGEYGFANVRALFPVQIGDSIEEGVHAFGRKIPGFDMPDCVLSGIESRTSSPVRIHRNEYFESLKGGIYPCGEGAGYAGGITSAAMDGIRVAEEIAKVYCNK